MDYIPDEGVRLDSTSATVPDKSLTPKQIRDRALNGQRILGTSQELIYDEGEEVLPDFTKMDITERLDYLSARRDELQKAARRLDAEALAVKQAEDKEEEKRRRNADDIEALLKKAAGESPQKGNNET